MLVEELMRQWELDTCYLSYHDYKHPAFIQVVQIGEAAIPKLVSLLGEGWFPVLVLFKILKDKAPEVPAESYGRFDDLNEIMRKWAKQNGY